MQVRVGRATARHDGGLRHLKQLDHFFQHDRIIKLAWRRQHGPGQLNWPRAVGVAQLRVGLGLQQALPNATPRAEIIRTCCLPRASQTGSRPPYREAGDTAAPHGEMQRGPFFQEAAALVQADLQGPAAQVT